MTIVCWCDSKPKEADMKERFETFTVLLSRISRNIRKIKNREMAAYGLRAPHISCLYYLYTDGPIAATDLCERCEEDKASISRSLDYLAKNGYLTRKATPDKRYKCPLVLTEKGKEVGQKIADRTAQLLDFASEGLTEEERKALYRCLSVICDRLDAVGTASDISSTHL